MRLTPKAEQLRSLIEPAVEACGMVLWGIEFSPQGKRSLLRVYIESPKAPPVTDGPSEFQVGVADCMKVSHQISGVLELHDPINGEYVLEVSSPGWDRRFFKPEQLFAYVGQTLDIRLIKPVNQQRKLNAILLSATESQISVQDTDDKIHELEVSNLDKITLVII